MPRMAFILDRIFKRYGLHGQSTLPLVLGGAFVGAAPFPALWQLKGLPTPEPGLATILTVPYMNCLAKVPLLHLAARCIFLRSDGNDDVLYFDRHPVYRSDRCPHADINGTADP